MTQSFYDVLSKTTSGNMTILKKATDDLNNLERQAGFGPIVLNILSNHQYQDIHLATSICLKNFIRKYWGGDELFDISAEDRQTIRNELIAKLLGCADVQLRRQFAESIILVASSDFPIEWSDMLDKLLGPGFHQDDLASVAGVLQCMDGICLKYRHQYKCEELWSEIDIVLKKFCETFFNICKAVCCRLESILTLPLEQQRLLAEIVNYSTRVFVSLIYQDLADHFEENLNFYMTYFLQILCVDLTPQSDRIVQEYIIDSKVSVCEGITLLMHVHSSEFANFALEFMKCVWTLLIALDRSNTELDTLKCSAMHFLAKAAANKEFSVHMSEQTVLQAICEQIVIPNITITDQDFEAYEDNPDDFIRRDIENSDSDTPRRAACDFIRALCLNMESQVVSVFGQYIEGLLQAFVDGSSDSWRQKDVATFLVICLAKKSHTSKHGVTVSSSLIDINRFFAETLQPHLTEPNVTYPILTIDAIKFIAEFRYVLSREVVARNLARLVALAGSDIYTLSVYASYSLERILSMQNGTAPFFKSEELKPIFGEILNNLLKALINQSTKSENEYAMKAVLKLVRREDLVDQVCAKMVLSRIIEIINCVAKNPRKPMFNHYAFETLGELLNWYAAKDTLSILSVYTTVHELLLFLTSHSIADFVPYALQLWTLMLSPRANGLGRNPELAASIADVVRNVDGILALGSACVPALAKLICFLIFYNDRLLFPSDTVKIIGFIRKTIMSKVRDCNGFDMLCVLVMKVDSDIARNLLREVYAMLFTRLTTAKTKRFMHDFIHFNSHVILRFGPKFTIETIDSLQPELFRMVCQNVYLSEMSQMRKYQKVAVVATSKILCERAFAQRYTNLWGHLLEATVDLSLTEKEKVVEASIFEDDEEKLEQLMQANDLSHNELKSCPPLQYNDHLLHFVASSGKQELMKEMSAFLNDPDVMQLLPDEDLNRAKLYLFERQ